MLAVSPAQPFPPGSTGCASPLLLLLLPCAGSQRGDMRCSPPPTRELVWEQNSRPTKVLCRGFPSCLCLCSLSWALKVTQVTRAMLLGSALQPELPRGARPWLWPPSLSPALLYFSEPSCCHRLATRMEFRESGSVPLGCMRPACR